MDFFTQVSNLILQSTLNIQGVLGVIVGGVLVVGVLGQVVFVAQKWARTTQLQDALAAIQYRQFIQAHKFPDVKSSDEFAKGKTLPVKNEKGHYNQC